MGGQNKITQTKNHGFGRWEVGKGAFFICMYRYVQYIFASRVSVSAYMCVWRLWRYPKYPLQKKYPPSSVSSMRCIHTIYPRLVDVNLHNFHFSTQTSSKTRRLGDSGAVGLGWCVPTTAVKAHVLPSKFAFRSFASHKARSRGRRGYAPQASFFYQFELFSGSLSPSGLGSRPVPQELRFKLI